MSELKTKPTEKSVKEFLETIQDEQQKKDAHTVLKMMEKITGFKAKMWGSSIVGFGTYHYVYATGREGDWPITGFSPRKTSLTIYIMLGFSRYQDLMDKLGKHKTGKSCLYIKRLADVDLKVLEKLIKTSFAEMKKKYPTK